MLFLRKSEFLLEKVNYSHYNANILQHQWH